MRLRPAVTLTVAISIVISACGGGRGDDPDAIATRTATVTAPVPTLTPEATDTQVPPLASTPTTAPATAPATGITLPAGFTAYVIAEGLNSPTQVATGPNGELYVSERFGSVRQLRDADGNGVFEVNETLASGLGVTTGLMVAPDGSIYASHTGTVSRFTPQGARADIITGLPNGRHQNNGLAIGPDGKLYLTNGSTCDDCTESDERSAAILQANLDGSGLRVYARGLRNPYDITFDASGRLWSTDNGSDTPCATVDELNLIVDGGDYGWPYGAQGCDEFNDGRPPVGDLGLHTASTGIDSYDGTQFPAEYRGNLFAMLWGSLAFGDPTYPPSLLRLVVSGSSANLEQFGRGFSQPIDVLMDRDGTLLVLDFGAGRLYRIVYTG
jgi:glucose/arabinose dehydrogenase